ncbi:flagellar protein FliT [Gilliamella sp. B2776]|uniref:flagellar protein FliT n=1 Tax=unclassified Gilliamella TaxID=2685620 RepID=UPI00226A4283|nr:MULTISPECIES: flagellar protein FliT [unclassified Gilliamella]MCX8650878.1 flagellar protein FliT [Gilliamella sp. B2779]MCX8654139.1 flagellar protein FliT [Gilliamella sp. B2737]MCX8665866.1 flagellar protein FliT [Gilliamella sp. B2887]MCX8692706.1 flagellar protein FliT [Gilliamella sp. B2776]MCX8699131.1 flagellar protein FliT [Gilliamella sp. B3000]
MNTDFLLEQYEQLNYVVEQMLIDTQKEDWESLIRWQPKYHQLTQELKLSEGFTVIKKMPLQYQDIIKMYFNNIISYHQQLTQLIQARRSELSQLIGKQVDYQTKINSYQNVANLV